MSFRASRPHNTATSHVDRRGDHVGWRAIDRMVGVGVLVEPHPGVLRYAGAPFTARARLSAATLAGGGGHASHRSAAWLHELSGFTKRQPLEITVSRGRFPALDGVVTHRWTGPRSDDYTTVDGIAVSGVATTLAQLGAVADSKEVEQALDDALRRGYPLAWIQATVERLHRPGTVGDRRAVATTA